MLDAHWYLCTSDTQDRKAYTLLCDEGEEKVLPVASIVQEHGLEFQRESRMESILKDSSHLALIAHNRSNVQCSVVFPSLSLLSAWRCRAVAP